MKWENLKGIVTVDSVEVTDGDRWKVNFRLETQMLTNTFAKEGQATLKLISVLVTIGHSQ